jgi:hypothetical protein
MAKTERGGGQAAAREGAWRGIGVMQGMRVWQRRDTEG